MINYEFKNLSEAIYTVAFGRFLQPKVIDIFHAGHAHVFFEKTHKMIIAVLCYKRQIYCKTIRK